MSKVPRRSVCPLVAAARKALEMSQFDLGQALGASPRTVQRWDAGRYAPDRDRLCVLARMVSVRDVPLARQIALAAGVTLESLGVVPALRDADAIHKDAVKDALVCAAAEAARVSPGRMRAGLAAVFARARALGVPLEDLEALTGSAPSAPP